MFVVAVYDISTLDKKGQKRLRLILKLMRQYLHHTQKSVFEGVISESKFLLLQKEIAGIIDDHEDYVVLYRIPDLKFIRRDTLGKNFDPNDVFI